MEREQGFSIFHEKSIAFSYGRRAKIEKLQLATQRKYLNFLRGYRMRFFLFIVIFLSTVSCGYKLTQDHPPLAIPFAEGDSSGQFTTILIKEFSSRGFDYKSMGSSLILKIQLLDWGNDNIGYRYGRHDDGTLKREILPTESKLRVKAKVVIFDELEKKEVWGPKIISAEIDYDYVHQTSLPDLSVNTPLPIHDTKESALAFSVGQLEDPSNAQEGACQPLFQHLAKKIVDVISGEW